MYIIKNNTSNTNFKINYMIVSSFDTTITIDSVRTASKYFTHHATTPVRINSCTCQVSSILSTGPKDVNKSYADQNIYLFQTHFHFGTRSQRSLLNVQKRFYFLDNRVRFESACPNV